MSSILQPRIQFRRPKPPWGARLIRGHPQAKGLAACLLFNEDGGDKVYDVSGNRLTGTLTNFTFPPTALSGWNPGESGPALAFEAANTNYINLGSPAILDTLTRITICTKVMLTGTDTTDARFVARHTGVDYGYLFCHVTTDNKVAFGISTDGTAWAAAASAANACPLNTKTSLIATYDGTTMRLYVGGVEHTGGDFPKALAGSINVASTDTQIGRDNVAGDAYSMAGLMEYMLLYDQAFTAQRAKEFDENPYGMFEWPMVWLGAIPVAVGNPWYAYAQQQ